MPSVLPLRRFGAALLILGGVSLAACRDAASALGSTPAQARLNADGLLGAMALRFGPVQLDPAYTALRARFARSSLTPSRIFGDSAVWTSIDGTTRGLELVGSRSRGRYIISMVREASTLEPAVRREGFPIEPGDYRHRALLRRIGDSEFEWRVHDALAVGTIQPNHLVAALELLFSAAGAASDASVREAYRQELPRTTAALGRLVALDTVRLSRAPGDATDLRLVATIAPRRLLATFPNFSRYLDKYLSPATYSVTISDKAGAEWWVATLRRNRVTARLRVARGSVVPLNAAPRSMPDSLYARSSISVKVGPFTVGFRDLTSVLTLVRTPRERGFLVRYRTEPEWILPPLVESMIRSPLRRPFEGDGATMAYTMLHPEAGPSLLTRDYAIVVRESGILRFINRLGNSTLSDFRAGAEREAEQFVGEMLSAMRSDVLALIGGERE